MEETCQISGCNEKAVKSISRKKAVEVFGGRVKAEGRRVHICKKHYKEFKKATKKERELERLTWR
ncbi:MAG: hypothetical protein DRN20_00385 [Thermoplasmata archaeon]|nr:MAG: hypothetical protein DRN20_00385 [Thermoplasmata archaeon]